MKGLSCVILFFLLVSCKPGHEGDCFRGNGPDVTEVREPGPFLHISLLDKFETHVYQAPVPRIEVTCGKHIIRNIKTEVRHDSLFISNTSLCNFVRGYKRLVKINIYTPKIKYIVNESVGNVYFSGDFSQDSIHARVANSGDFYLDGTFNKIKTTSSGNGDMYVTGRCNQLFVFTTGINFVNTRGLFVRDMMFIHTVSIGDCLVNADGTGYMDYRIQNEGNVYFRGKPRNQGGFIDPGATGTLIDDN